MYGEHCYDSISTSELEKFGLLFQEFNNADY